MTIFNRLPNLPFMPASPIPQVMHAMPAMPMGSPPAMNILRFAEIGNLANHLLGLAWTSWQPIAFSR